MPSTHVSHSSTARAMAFEPSHHPLDSSSLCSGPESMGLRRERVSSWTTSTMLVLLAALVALFAGTLLV